MDILRANYGVPSVAEIQHKKNILLVLHQQNTAIRDFIRVQREVHQTLQDAGQGLAMADKVAAVRAEVKHVPTFANAVQHFLTTHPTVGAQTFDLFIGHLARGG
jgi:hypothetical protein